jgi:hypothetical protein
MSKRYLIECPNCQDWQYMAPEDRSKCHCCDDLVEIEVGEEELQKLTLSLGRVQIIPTNAIEEGRRQEAVGAACALRMGRRIDCRGILTRQQPLDR